MRLSRVAFIGIACTLALCGPSALRAQETPATVTDPISPADCLKDKKKALECQHIGLTYANGEQGAPDPVKAAEFLDAACRAEVPRACGQYGRLLLRPHARAGDAERAAQVLEKACAQKDIEACTALGGVYADGLGVPRDVPRAAKLLDLGCENGHSRACGALARLLDAGNGIQRDAVRAKTLMDRACTLGDTETCERACTSGDGKSCLAWGRWLRDQAPDDDTAADNAYTLACDAGAAEGCDRLAARTKDGARSVAFLERACTVGDTLACAEAARSYYHGRGLAADLGAAARLYATACEKRSSAACITLGGIYARGERGEGEQAKSQEYFLKACGEDVACQTIVANGNVPSEWGVSLEALRPSQESAVRVGGMLLREVPPVYPYQEMGGPGCTITLKEGAVTLECVVSPDGNVTDVRAKSGLKQLIPAAVKAVRQWVYTPMLVDGVPVSVTRTVTVNFKVNR